MSGAPAGEGGADASPLSRLLEAWVRGVRQRARGVIWAFAVTTLVLIGYTVLRLGINASHTALLSDDLAFWLEYNAFAEVFPIVDEALFVVVDGDSAIQANDATEALAIRLRSDERLRVSTSRAAAPFSSGTPSST
jgi:hypothetical protein